MMQADLFDPPRPEVVVTPAVARAPKIDLHRHLLGSLTCDHVLQLAIEHELPIPTHSPTHLEDLLTIQRPVAGLREFFKPWSTLSKLLVSPEVVESIAYLALKQAYEDRVVYAEFRASWGMTGRSPFSADEFLGALSAGFRRAEVEFGVVGRVVLGITRHMFIHHIPDIRRSLWSAILKAALRHRGSLVVGFDLSGLEDNYPARLYSRELTEARDNGFSLTIHAGETTTSREVRDVVEMLRPHRIGHGLAAVTDDRLMGILADRNIAVEACPTSNWLTKTVADLKHHPLTTLHERGVPVTLNTDNPGVCRTTLSREHAIVAQHMEATPRMFEAFARNALNHMFADRPLRDRIATIWFSELIPSPAAKLVFERP